MSKTPLLTKLMGPTIQTETGAVMTRKTTNSGAKVPAKAMMTALGLVTLDRPKIGGMLIPKLTLRSISLSFRGRLATRTSMSSSPDSVKLKR